MSPLSAIPAPLPVYGLAPQQRVAAPDLVGELPAPAETTGAVGATDRAGDSFSNVLGRMVQEVNTQQNVASDTVAALQSGQNVSLHQAVIAMEEANVSFQLMVEVRNRLLESYQEIMRMQL